MKRTLLSFILAIGMVANIWADTVIEGIKYALNDDFTATVTGLDDPSFTGTITIPETIKSYGNTYQVVQIGNKAFFEYKFKSVVIPNSVTSIGSYAFQGCTNLTSVTINSNAIFSYSSRLKNIFGEQVKEYKIGDNVEKIGDYAFENCTSLTTVTIPNSVTSIGFNAFRNNTGLTAINVDGNNINYSSIDGVLFNKSQTELIRYPGGKQGAYTIPNSVTSIVSAAFYNCTGLTSIEIPNSVTSIGGSAFWGCTGLTSIEIPNSVTSIEYATFYNCTGLTSIEIPNSVTSIEYSAFRGCTGLTSVTIPNSVTSIKGYTFWDCTGLTSIDIPNSVTSIGSEAFKRCTGLTSVTIPNSVTSIGSYAFSGCTGLTAINVDENNTAYSSIDGVLLNKSQTELIKYPEGKQGTYTIPNSVASIENYAFAYCSGLTSVTIPNSVTSIGIYAFFRCTGLTSIDISNSETSIGDFAFENCTGLTDIYCHIEEPLTIKSIIFKNVSTITCTLHVPIGSKEKYKAADVWKNFLNIIEDLPAASSFTIGNLKYTIMSNSTVRVSKDGTLTGELVIPESVEYEGKQYSVTRISFGAFEYCTGLTSVTIPNSVTSIGAYAFSGCTGLTSVTINSNAIMSKSYSNSSNNLSTIFGKQVQTYIIGDSVTSIGVRAFEGCTGLTSVTIPNSVTSIRNYAFVNCTGLTAINVDENNTAYSSIDGVLFNKSQTELVQYPGGKQGAYTIPNSVTSIGSYAFYKCTGLTSVTIGNSVTSIGISAFEGCTGLTSVTINSNAIMSKTYSYSSNFSTIFGKQVQTYIIGDSVTSIGEWAFYNCIGLTSIDIPNSVTSIGNYAFNCTGLTSVDIPNSVTSIGDWVFAGCSGLTSITIPNSVTSIGRYAFRNCTGLTDIYCHIEEPLTIESSVFENVSTNTCTLHVPIGSKEKYEVADVWKVFLNIVEDLPTGIVSIDHSQSTIDNDVWYTLNGVRLNGKPTKAGIYIVNGKKVVVK